MVRIVFRNLKVGAFTNTSDFSEVIIPPNKLFVAWCGISYIYPTHGFDKSYVVIDIFQHKKRESSIDTYHLGSGYRRGIWSWNGDFGPAGHYYNARQPAMADLSGPYGTIINFRLYTNILGGKTARAGGFGIVYYDNPSVFD